MRLRKMFVLMAAVTTFAAAESASACQACLAGGRSLHGSPFLPAGSAVAAALSGAPLSGGSSAGLLPVPTYSSNPSAAIKLYLNFGGDVSNQYYAYGGGTVTGNAGYPGTTPAYDTDNNPASFSNSELSNIENIWQRVAEKYSPFNIDVTTVTPTNNGSGQALSVVIGGNYSDWYGAPAAGVSYIDAFHFGADSAKSYAFSAALSPSNPNHTRWVSEAVAHEAGHGFGLDHQSAYDTFGNKTQEYNNNNSSALRQPLMGYPYGAQRSLWWNGPSASGVSIVQDDLAKLSNTYNGFGYRSDDHGNSIATATVLASDGAGATASGVITTVTDVDVFSFDTTGGLTTFTVDVAPFGAMLDASLQIRDAGNNILASSATANLGETLSLSLTAGLYNVFVSSAGSYGDIGQFTLTGSFPSSVVPEPVFASFVLTVALLVRRRR